MCPVVRSGSTPLVRDTTNVQNKPKAVTKPTNTPVKNTEPVDIKPKDNNSSKKLEADNLNKQVSFKGQIPPKKESSTVKDVTKYSHKGHVAYEVATSAEKALKASAHVASKAGNVVALSSQLKAATASNVVAKAAHSTATGAGVATMYTGKALKTASNLANSKVLHAAHHGTEAVQKAALLKTSQALGKAGMTKAAGVVGNLAKTASHASHAAHAAHAVKVTGTVVKTGVTVAKVAGVVGKVMPGVGFAAGMVGAGLATKEAMDSKTTAGKVAHGTRAALNVVAGVASFVPGVGTAVGLIATGADLGIAYAAKKFGWN